MKNPYIFWNLSLMTVIYLMLNATPCLPFFQERSSNKEVKCYIDRPDLYERLYNYPKSNTHSVVIHGNPGSGKTQFFKKMASDNPDAYYFNCAGKSKICYIEFVRSMRFEGLWTIIFNQILMKWDAADYGNTIREKLEQIPSYIPGYLRSGNLKIIIDDFNLASEQDQQDFYNLAKDFYDEFQFFFVASEGTRLTDAVNFGKDRVLSTPFPTLKEDESKRYLECLIKTYDASLLPSISKTQVFKLDRSFIMFSLIAGSMVRNKKSVLAADNLSNLANILLNDQIVLENLDGKFRYSKIPGSSTTLNSNTAAIAEGMRLLIDSDGKMPIRKLEAFIPAEIIRKTVFMTELTGKVYYVTFMSEFVKMYAEEIYGKYSTDDAWTEWQIEINKIRDQSK